MAEQHKLKPLTFFGVRFNPIKKSDTDARGSCPFCQHDSEDGKGGKLYVNLETVQWDCKHCKRDGNLYTFLRDIHSLSLERTTKDDYATLANYRQPLNIATLRNSGIARWSGSTEHGTSTWLVPYFNLRNNIVGIRHFSLTIPGSEPQSGRRGGATGDQPTSSRRKKRSGNVRASSSENGGEVAKPVGPIMAVPGLPLYLGNVNRLQPAGPIYLLGGEWDGMAMSQLIEETKTNGNPLWVPGESVFKSDWVQYFEGRDVYCMYDNDQTGSESNEKVAMLLRGRAARVRTIQWPSSLPDKYDVRDCITERKKEGGRNNTPKKILADLERICMLAEGNTQAMADAQTTINLGYECTRTSFSKVVQDFKSKYHFDKNMENGLALCLAVIASNKMKGDPLWLFVVGPPGSGKSLLCKAFQRSPHCVFKSRLKSSNFVSGYVMDDGSDQSVLPRLVNKNLIIKDYTTLMSMAQTEQEALYGMLRDAYDGRVDVPFGNEVGERVFIDCYFSMFAGVTDEIHRDNRATLGERFLKYQLIEGHRYDPEQHMRNALSGMAEEAEADAYIQQVCAAYIDHIMDQPIDKIPGLPVWVVERLIALAQIIALLRSTPAYIGGMSQDNIAFRPSAEIGTRLVKQLGKVTQFLAFVTNKRSVDMDTYRIAEQLGLDTAYGWSRDIVFYLSQFKPDDPQSTGEIQKGANIPRTTLDRQLTNLTLLNVVEDFEQITDPDMEGAPPTLNRNIPPAGGDNTPRGLRRVGRPSRFYRLSEHFRNLWERAKITADPTK